MSDVAVISLAAMAVALIVMAGVQIGVIVIALKASRQMTSAIEELRREVRPLAEKVHSLTDEASKVTSLARLQVERVDQFMTTTARGMDETFSLIQGLVSGPIRQGASVLTAVKAAMLIIRHWQTRTGTGREPEEDPLFVG